MPGDECQTKAAIEAYARILFEPSDIVEVRRLPSGRSSWHEAAHLAEVTAGLNRDNDAGQNIYVGASPRRERGGTKAADVLLARCLFTDFDDGIAPGEALERIRQAGLPRPTLLIFSGHGTHAYWRLTEPLTDLAEWTRLQKLLILTVGSDPSVHDPPRIMRLPGLWNRKQEPFIRCEIVESAPGRRYDPNELHTALEAACPDGELHD